MSQDGLLVTHKNVVTNTSFIGVDTDGNIYTIEKLYPDPSSELVFVKLIESDLVHVPVEIERESSSTGQRVAVVGSFWNGSTPYVISSILKNTGDFIFSNNGYDGLYHIDRDIPINNIGSPVINSSGRVIGLVTSDEDINQTPLIPLTNLTTIIRSLDENDAIQGVVFDADYRLIDEVFATKNTLPIFAGAYLLNDSQLLGRLSTDTILKIDAFTVSKKNPIEKILKNFLPNEMVRVQYFSSQEFLNAPKNDVSNISDFIEQFVYEEEVILR